MDLVDSEPTRKFNPLEPICKSSILPTDPMVHSVKEMAIQTKVLLQSLEKRHQLHEYRSNLTPRVAMLARADRIKASVLELERSANRGLERGLAEQVRCLEK